MAGVGGRTIAEAKQNLSVEEFHRWKAYRGMRGSLNVGRRLEIGLGQLCALYAQAHGSKLSSYDFMPHEEEPEITLAEAMETWR